MPPFEEVRFRRRIIAHIHGALLGEGEDLEHAAELMIRNRRDQRAQLHDERVVRRRELREGPCVWVGAELRTRTIQRLVYELLEPRGFEGGALLDATHPTHQHQPRLEARRPLRRCSHRILPSSLLEKVAEDVCPRLGLSLYGIVGQAFHGASEFGGEP